MLAVKSDNTILYTVTNHDTLWYFGLYYSDSPCTLLNIVSNSDHLPETEMLSKTLNYHVEVYDRLLLLSLQQRCVRHCMRQTDFSIYILHLFLLLGLFPCSIFNGTNNKNII